MILFVSFEDNAANMEIDISPSMLAIITPMTPSLVKPGCKKLLTGRLWVTDDTLEVNRNTRY